MHKFSNKFRHTNELLTITEISSSVLNFRRKKNYRNGLKVALSTLKHLKLQHFRSTGSFINFEQENYDRALTVAVHISFKLVNGTFLRKKCSHLFDCISNNQSRKLKATCNLLTCISISGNAKIWEELKNNSRRT